ncbi:MAG: biotin--[acetyl-CoA-carboxylase] ligase [Desulfobulbaceae bacterium]|jgi:BirA family biotin operon repressor/biotin-[acetyl-CoA-carboxylase] ligase|nr:biotin--[acetyl-CoA-carboxylase] ligase [Desulfobulbaceae bacterium]MDY0350647.1 biotin--[acetyl-CoA-carboxylase] ligase [Desulfobulbaceae bacterium]
MTIRIFRYGRVRSTNVIALELAGRNEKDTTVILADQQTAGSGRRGRQFFSPPGGLYMSIILRPTLAPERLPLITLAAGVACARALEEQTGLRIRLKWPNDLYLGERKLGGILTEAAPYSPARGAIPFVVVGIGVNVNTRAESFPEELRNHLVSLYDVLRRRIDIPGLAAGIAEQLMAAAAALDGDVDGVLAAWRRRDFLLDRHIEWLDPQGRRVRGYGAGLMNDGCYRLTTAESAEYAVLSGDLVIRAGRE